MVKVTIEARTKGNKDLKEMLRKCLMLRIRTLNLDGGKD